MVLHGRDRCDTGRLEDARARLQLVEGGTEHDPVRYAQVLPKIKFNALAPGEVANHKFTATDMNNHTGQLTVTEGSDPVIELATLDADEPTGTFIDRLGLVAW